MIPASIAGNNNGNVDHFMSMCTYLFIEYRYVKLVAIQLVKHFNFVCLQHFLSRLSENSRIQCFLWPVILGNQNVYTFGIRHQNFIISFYFYTWNVQHLNCFLRKLVIYIFLSPFYIFAVTFPLDAYY